MIICDRFILGSLQDAVAGRWPIEPRVTRWSSEATEDITGFRRLVADGPLSIDPASRNLARVGLSQAIVAGDDQGSVRLQKRRAHMSRDDVAVSGVLAVRRTRAHPGASSSASGHIRFALGRMSRRHIALDRHRWFRVRRDRAGSVTAGDAAPAGILAAPSRSITSYRCGSTPTKTPTTPPDARHCASTRATRRRRGTRAAASGPTKERRLA